MHIEYQCVFVSVLIGCVNRYNVASLKQDVTVNIVFTVTSVTFTNILYYVVAMKG